MLPATKPDIMIPQSFKKKYKTGEITVEIIKMTINFLFFRFFKVINKKYIGFKKTKLIRSCALNNDEKKYPITVHKTDPIHRVPPSPKKY